MFENFAKLPLSRRILLGVIAFVIAATFLFAIYFAFFREQYEPLYTNLQTAEAAAVVAELEERNIPYELADGETTLLVPADQLAATKIALAGSDLSIKGLVGFELFNESDMGITEFAQKINYQRALQGELSRSIMMIDGIESARVHLAIPARAIFKRDESVAKAAVTIQPMPGKKPTKAMVQGIQALVAASVTDMSFANVSVIDDAGRVISDNVPAPVPQTSTETGQATAMQTYYEARIREALESGFPGRNAKISVAISDILQRGAAPTETVDTALIQQLGGTPPAGESRKFRLLVVVTFRAAPDSETKAAMTNAVAEAIGFDRSLGDQIFFTTDPEITAQPPRVPVTDSYEAPETPQKLDLPFKITPPVYWAAIGLFALFLCILVFVFRRKKPKNDMAPENDHASFAEQLQAKLDGLNEGEHAKP